MKFRTISGSIYEVDLKEKKIRRLIGAEDPTPRQGEDGEWRIFDRIDIEEGKHAWIFWDPETILLLDGNVFGGDPATITSSVVEIYSDALVN